MIPPPRRRSLHIELHFAPGGDRIHSFVKFYPEQVVFMVDGGLCSPDCDNEFLAFT